MTVARFYEMRAAGDKTAALRFALQDLAGTVSNVSGCLGVDVMQDAGDDRRFVFIERWSSTDAHRQSAESVPKSAFSAVMAALDGAPQTADFNYLT
jgi:quinol monooxygenase YgiN